MARKRILLADDNAEFLEDVQPLLSGTYDIVGAVQDGSTLVDAARSLEPDLIISDISMPVMSGFEAASRIRALGLTAKFIFLSVQTSPAYIRKARSVGASGYVVKAHATEQLPRAVSGVLAGGTFFSTGSETPGES